MIRQGSIWQIAGLLALAACGGSTAEPRTGGATCTPTSMSSSGGGCRIDFGCSDGVRRAANCSGTECVCLAADTAVARFPMIGFCALATAPQVAAVAEHCVEAWTAVIGGAMPDAGQADAGAQDATDLGGDAVGDDAPGADSGPDPDVTARPIVVVAGNTTTRPSCAAVCSAMGLTCAVSCRNRGFVSRQPMAVAGWAMYSSVAMFTVNEDRYFFRCDDAIDESCSRSFTPGRDFDCPPRPGTGTPFRLQQYNCCCER